jgi:hypothetical protein
MWLTNLDAIEHRPSTNAELVVQADHSSAPVLATNRVEFTRMRAARVAGATSRALATRRDPARRPGGADDLSDAACQKVIVSADAAIAFGSGFLAFD